MLLPPSEQQAGAVTSPAEAVPSRCVLKFVVLERIVARDRVPEIGL